MTIASELRDRIKKSGDSANVLAGKLGLSQPTISRLLLGNDIKLSVADLLADHFGLELTPKVSSKTPSRLVKSRAKKK